MAKKFTTREFIDHHSLSVFMEDAGGAVDPVSIVHTASGTLVLFAYDDTELLKDAEVSEFEYGGPGRGFRIDAPIPSHFVETVDIKTLAVVPVEGYVPARLVDGVMVAATTEAALEENRRQKVHDDEVAAIEAALIAKRMERPK